MALFVGLTAALFYSGAAVARQVSDPGALVRWGLPVSKALHNVSIATVIGGLIFAVGILPRTLAGSRSKDKDAPEHPAFTRALAISAAAGAIWTMSAIAVLVLSYSDVAGQGISGDAEFTRSLVYFMTDIETGRAWLAVTIIAAVVTTALFGVRSRGGLAATLLLALVGLVPTALIGHSSSSDDHEGAINSLGLHLLGVSTWLGGIIILVLLSGILTGPSTAGAGQASSRPDITEPVLRRFSALAGFAFVLVFASGVVNASIRVTSWSDLFGSPYGQLILAKSAATLVLGGVGLMHRRWVIPQLGSQGGGLSARRVLWQLVVVELIVMGATSGIAVALGRSAPPEPERTTFAPDASPAFILSGYELPPELTPGRWLTEWRLDWLWVAVALFGLVTYFRGVWRVSRRGDAWPWFRSVNWVIGLLVLTYITSGPPSVYGRILFSAHMVDHMALTMVAPIFLVLGAPVTLALRALPSRRDSSRGPREWLLIFVHSKFSQLVTHPLFAAANFAGSIVLFYYSDAFGYAMRDHVGHELMILHFALTGYIFVLTMIGTDPLPRRAPYPMRLMILLATMGFHAFFGVAIMGGTNLLAADYFGNLGRTWGPSALLDQQMGGAVAWGIGEVPTLLVAIGVAVMWSRSDARESKRTDRAADRNNDADLTAYNDMFARLAERDAKLAERNSKLEGRS